MVRVTKVVDGGPLVNSPEQFTICVDSRSESTGVILPAQPRCLPGSGSGSTYLVAPGAIIISEIPPRARL